MDTACNRKEFFSFFGGFIFLFPRPFLPCLENLGSWCFGPVSRSLGKIGKRWGMKWECGSKEAAALLRILYLIVGPTIPHHCTSNLDHTSPYLTPKKYLTKMAFTELAALYKAPLLFGIVELDFHILFRWNWCFLWELFIKSDMAVHIYILYSFLVFWKGWYCALPLYLSLSSHNSLPASSPLSLPTLASASHHTPVGIPLPPTRPLVSLKLCSLYDCK